MNSNEVRQKFLEFFKKRGHVIIPSASLIPETDSVLFTTAGMQPLIPYLLGKNHPDGRKLVNSQKCVRTQDILEVGDNTHDTFFEMLGNWSLGDYFKEEAIKWSYELLTSKTEGFGLDPKRLYVTVFEGDENALKDTEAFEIWKKFVPENRIYFMGAKSNWWSVGDNGPCGPDTEMFYDITKDGLGDLTKEEYIKADDEQKVVEIWNDVFMQYLKKDGKVTGTLEQKNVDTGSGLERLVMVIQGKDNIFDTDLFYPVMQKIKENSKSKDIKGMRIVADHIRTSTFMIADSVKPANTGRGYILRRLLRRAIYYYNSLGSTSKLSELIDYVIPVYTGTDYELDKKASEISETINQEEIKFLKTLQSGKKILEQNLRKGGSISAEKAFLLYSTYGYPFELIKELALENNCTIDEEGFFNELKKHQELSRKGGEKKFKAVLE